MQERYPSGHLGHTSLSLHGKLPLSIHALTPNWGLPKGDTWLLFHFLSVLTGLIPDLTCLPFLLQTSLHTAETETPAPQLPPTPPPSAITTTVTIGRNATVLQVGGKWIVLGQLVGW